MPNYQKKPQVISGSGVGLECETTGSSALRIARARGTHGSIPQLRPVW